MINVLEFVYGSGLTPDANPIHLFDPDRDLYQHAEFEKDNGDFYQIVKVSDRLSLYHFQKMDATISANRLEGNWWLRHDEFKRKYENKQAIFTEKIHDRLIHGYKVIRLVMLKNSIDFPGTHPQQQELRKVFLS